MKNLFTLILILFLMNYCFAQDEIIAGCNNQKSNQDKITFLYLSLGIGMKYFPIRPEGVYYKNDPKYKIDYANMLNIGIKLSTAEKHFFITELKYFRSPIYSYGVHHDVFIITLLYKYRLEILKNIAAASQIGYNIYTNKEKNYFFSNALDIGIEYQIGNVNIFLKNNLNINIFTGAYLPSFLFAGIIFSI